MARTILLYALVLGAAATLLTWLQYRYLAHAFSTEIYIGLIAVAFVALGVWTGSRLTPRLSAQGPFRRNEAAVRSLGLSPREMEIVEALASGASNKEMARRLGISVATLLGPSRTQVPVYASGGFTSLKRMTTPPMASSTGTSTSVRPSTSPRFAWSMR